MAYSIQKLGDFIKGNKSGPKECQMKWRTVLCQRHACYCVYLHTKGIRLEWKHHLYFYSRKKINELTVTGITFDHLVGWFKAGIGDLSNRELLMVSLLSGDNRRIGSQGEVNTWVGHQVCLELGEIYVQRTVETQGRSDGAHNLTDQPGEGK